MPAACKKFLQLQLGYHDLRPLVNSVLQKLSLKYTIQIYYYLLHLSSLIGEDFWLELLELFTCFCRLPSYFSIIL